MGNIVGSALEKQQEKAITAQKVMLSRQIEMQQTMRERMMAVQVAGARDMFMFYGGAMALIFPLLIIGSIKKKNPALLGPIIPFSFILAYQYDWAYYTKADRIMKEADHILQHEKHYLYFPGGELTVETIDKLIELRLEQHRQQQRQ